MGKLYTPTPISNIYSSVNTINQNLDDIADALDLTLARDGSIPNSMSADLDMNSNDLLNVGDLYVDNFFIDGSQLPSLEDIIENYAQAVAAKEAAEAAQGLAEDAQVAAEAAQTAAETAETGAQTAETNAETAQAAAESARIGAEAAETAAETAQTAAELAQSNAETAATNAATSETNAAQSATDAQTAETNAEASASSAQMDAAAAAVDADDAETARIAAEAAAAGVNLPSAPPGSEGQFLRVNPAETGYLLDSFYEYTTVPLTGSGNFTGGVLRLAKVGDVVTITSYTAVTHTTGAASTSASGLIPINFLPVDSISNVNLSLPGGDFQATTVTISGAIGVSYSVSRTAALAPLNISYVTQPSI